MNDQDRLMDLLATRATEGLSDDEYRELYRSRREWTGAEEDDLELAAAAADLAIHAALADDEAMPDSLRQKILEQSRAHLPASTFRRARKRHPLAAGYLGWYAAAAMLLLALWTSRPPEFESPKPGLTLAEQRSVLIENAEDAIQVAWAAPEIQDYTQVRGDVVWSNDRQAGFMRLRGLPANRSAQEQYQLWIVDPSRDARPIDGGVFDIPAGVDEVLIPIDAKLQVDAPKVFAITLEKPGGVVVSDGPLLVVAAVET